MSSCRVVLGWLTALLLMGGCSGGIQRVSARHHDVTVHDVTVAATARLEDGIEMLSVAEAEILRNRRAGETPEDLPSHALAVAFFGVGEHDDPPRRPSELLVANYWSTPLRMNVVCLVDGVQGSCSQEAGVWRVELDEPGIAMVALPESDARRDVILAEERDHMAGRVEPAALRADRGGHLVAARPDLGSVGQRRCRRVLGDSRSLLRSGVRRLSPARPACPGRVSVVVLDQDAQRSGCDAVVESEACRAWMDD